MWVEEGLRGVDRVPKLPAGPSQLTVALPGGPAPRVRDVVESCQKAKSQQPLPPPQPLAHMQPQPLPPPPQLPPPLQQLLPQHVWQLGLAINQLPSARHARTTAGSATTVPASRPLSQLTVAVVRRQASALF
jgi:hypothetical protein